MNIAPTSRTTLFNLPCELQVHTLTFLRAFDLSALQQTCRFFNDQNLIHKVVAHTAEYVYFLDMTQGILDATSATKGKAKRCDESSDGHYTIQHMRDMELSVVARLLSSPEPKSGYYVSRSWVKKTLLWLEKVNSAECATTGSSKKKPNKKQQRQRARRLSDVTAPWPNVNSDLLCTHDNLQRCGAKSARSRRRLMDKHSWKILKKLYPHSTQLDSANGECLQCLVETETARRTERDQMEQAKLERKRPLSNEHVRNVYTRTRGVPTHKLVASNDRLTTPMKACGPMCPLVAGVYYLIPRSWCHQWRRYLKTGEGGMPQPPESSSLLCHAHRLALLPPHLEAYLQGETTQLWSPLPRAFVDDSIIQSPMGTPVGLRPSLDAEAVNALMVAGISHAELASQQMAMMQLEQNRIATLSSPETRGESPALINARLDRENYLVVELVTEEELQALQDSGCWPRQRNDFTIALSVTESGKYSFSTVPCRECDASASASCVALKPNRQKTCGKTPKASDKARGVATRLEY